MNYVINNKIDNPLSFKDNFKELGYYLAGLIESDGSIIIPKENSINTPSITISFHEQDKPLAQKICEVLGYGSVELIPSNKVVKVHIRRKFSIINISTLINGKFRTPKIEKLNNLINYINKNWNKSLNESLFLSQPDNSPLESNS
jgi:hypothetical protein